MPAELRVKKRRSDHPDVDWVGKCKNCQYPVVQTTTNNGHPMAVQGWDWWAYCTNQACVNHTGAGVDQYLPDFVDDD